MDKEQINIFPGAAAESNCGGPAPVVCASGLQTDLTDSPISQTGVFDDGAVYVTAPIGGLGTSGQFAYLSNWQRVVNDPAVGIPNYFTWLDAYSPNPVILGTVRQAFAGGTSSLNPYVASAVRDHYVIGNVYDSLNTLNPLNGAQLLDWMVTSSSQTPLPNSQLGYTPPTGTIATYRFQLRNDMFFHDGRRVTAFDVSFSYLSLTATGASQAQGTAVMTGVTVRSPTQFDIGVNSTSPSTKINLTNLTILPGRYWTAVGSTAWDADVSRCLQTLGCYPAQYTLGSVPPSGPAPALCSLTCTFPASDMNADPAKTSPSFDPVLSHVLVGSGPWTCGVVTTLGSGICTSTGTMNPPIGGFYDLTRFGIGLLPGSSATQDYFRSSGNLALWVWSGDNGDFTHDFLNFATVAHCFGQPIAGTPNPCTHYQQGIGTNGIPTIVGISQVSIVARFIGTNWISPFSWQTNPPTGIAPLSGIPPLILYAGAYTLNPAAVVGCPSGYDC